MKLLFRWINKLLCGWNVGLYFRPRIRYEGKKCLPAFTRGPAILITNHKNQMDFLLVLYLFYFRYVRCLVGKTFYECNRFLNWCLRMLGAIKVDRFSFGMDFFCESVEALRRGQLLLIFPEGRFSTTGEILEFRSTAALLALQTDVPIIPMWHSVNYGFGKRTDVVIGEPIRLSELCSTANPDAAELDRLTAILRDKVIELRGMARRREPCGSCCSGCGISPQILQILWAASACALSGCRSSIFRPARSMCARTPVRRCSC